MGISYREVIYGLGGGPLEEAKAFIPGGSSCPMFPMTDEYLDMPVEYASVAKAGSMLGTGGLMVIPKEKMHRGPDVQHRALLRPRVLRQMHALPRRREHLVAQDVSEDASRFG